MNGARGAWQETVDEYIHVFLIVRYDYTMGGICDKMDQVLLHMHVVQKRPFWQSYSPDILGK